MVSLCWVKCDTGLYCKNYKKNGYSQCHKHLQKSNFTLHTTILMILMIFMINILYDKQYVQFQLYYKQYYEQYVLYINNIKYEQYIISIYKMDKSYKELYKQILINVKNIILVYFYKLKNTLF